MEKVHRFLQLRPRSSAEVKDYLMYRLNIDEEETIKIITELMDRELLSDEKFAQWYLDYKLASGANGINKIKTELLQKKISTQLISFV